MPGLLVPNLPVLSWQTLGKSGADALPAVLDVKNRVWTASGRAAIAFALREMRVGAGDRVLVPTYHCPTMIAPIVAAGAQPLFYPISNSGLPQLEYIRGLNLKGVRGMIAAHFFGLPQRMSLVREFCDQQGIALIEDCAHAMFGIADGRPIGTWGDYAIASLTKFFPVLEGGCLVSAEHSLSASPPHTRSWRGEMRNIADILETAVRHGRLPGANTALSALFAMKGALRNRPRGPVIRDCDIVPDVVRRGLADFGARAAAWSAPYRGSVWLARHAGRDRIVALRRRNYLRLAERLGGVSGARPLCPGLRPDAAPYVFPLIVEQPERHYLQFRSRGVPVFRWDWCWPDVPAIEGDSGADWARSVFQIGCHQELGLAEIDMIAETIAKLLSSGTGSE